MIDKKILLTVCFVVSVIWGIVERIYGVKVTDQAFLAGLSLVLLAWCN